MSGTWSTQFYFSPHRGCLLSFCRAVVERFLADGCSFLRPNTDFAYGAYCSLDGLEYDDAPSLEGALAWIVQRGMGAIQLWHLASEVEFFISFDPCGRASREDQPSEAAASYGSTLLWLDRVYLKDREGEETERNYRLVYRWSSVLASVVAPFYGWGDLEFYFGGTDFSISPLDLERQTIPRLSWWNYFSTAFLEQLREGQLSTYAAWLDHRDAQGRTVILHPPGVPIHATSEEARTLLAAPDPWHPDGGDETRTSSGLFLDPPEGAYGEGAKAPHFDGYREEAEARIR